MQLAAGKPEKQRRKSAEPKNCVSQVTFTRLHLTDAYANEYGNGANFDPSEN